MAMDRLLENSTKLKDMNINEIHIFIPVDVNFQKNYPAPPTEIEIEPDYFSGVLYIPEFSQADLDAAKIANFLILLSKNGMNAVGLTYTEALQIENEHSHPLPALIIQAAIPVNRLSSRAQSEKEFSDPNCINMSKNKYFWLLPDTLFEPKQIISVKVMQMREYKNTVRFNPKKFQVLLSCNFLYQSDNIVTIQAISLDSLINFAEQELKRLKHSYFAAHKINALNLAVKNAKENIGTSHESENSIELRKALSTQRFPMLDTLLFKKPNQPASSQITLEKQQEISLKK